MPMDSWLSRTTQFWSEWGLRIAVLSSTAAHVALVVLARTRRQHASILGALFLWPVYEAASKAGTYALGKLSLSSDGATSSSSSASCQQQLVAFWAPFLLLHLARPDNISAYALEDNKLSWRQALDVFLQVLGVTYVVYQYIYLGGGGDLLPASAVMFVAGSAKYVERAVALWRGDLSNIRGSSGDKKRRSSEPVGSATVLGNEQALLMAHSLFDFCRRAMVDDSSVQEEDASSPATSERIFSLEWRSMRKVVEMELSLMYDILYTKATVVHTWTGYAIRVLSPVATATAATLFCLFPKDCLETADVVITYTLLAVAFVLDVVWLVKALGSTWAYAFLDARPGTWLYHEVLCRGWWRWLRCIVVALDPSNLLLGRDPRSYRKWSGKIGQYNLLDECTRARGHSTTDLRDWILAKVGLENSRYLFPFPPGVNRLVFNRIRRRLPTHGKHRGESPNDPYTMKDITTLWGQAAVRRRRHLFDDGEDEPPSFGREFQEDILVWHIGTCIFLACADQQLVRQGDGVKYTNAIEVLSEYLMFLVAMRRDMLPGLVLRSLFEVTQQSLREVWLESGGEKCSISRSVRKEKLAEDLCTKKSNNTKLYWEPGYAKRRLISDGAGLAVLLLQVNIQELLELVFDVWVDKLLYASTRCNRESHAKQLSRGGELTTIVWIMAEHAGPFRIGQFAYEPEEPEADKEPEPPKKEKPRPAPPPKKDEPKTKKEEPRPPPPPKPKPPKKEEPRPPPPEPPKKEEPRPPPPRAKRTFATLYPPY